MRALVLGALIPLLSAPIAFAYRRSLHDRRDDPAGSLRSRLRPCGTRTGEDQGSGARPACARMRTVRGTRRSLVFFGQLTDPQIADETSPARVDFVDPAGGEQLVVAPAGGARAAGLRPEGAQHQRQPHERAARRRQAGQARFAIMTGDLADNQQFNETRWFKTVLDGGRVTRSRARRSAPEPVPGRVGGDVAAINDDGRRPALRASPTTTTTRASPPTATAASGIRTSAAAGARTPRSRATRG